MNQTRGRTIRSVVAGAGLCALLVAGCSSGSDSSSSVAPHQAGGNSAAQHQRDSAGSSAAKADLVTRADRKLIRTADLTIRVKTIKSSLDRVRTIARDAGGYPTEEQVGGYQGRCHEPDEDYGDTAEVTLAVPAERLDATLRKLGSVGTVTERSSSSDDVTKKYVDTSSRIKTMRTSIERLRRLMKDSTDLGDVTKLESALTERESTLESLQSQLSSLKGEVAMSKVTVKLSTTATSPSEAGSSPHGFGEGLSSGWNAFVSVVATVITALGVLLPFLVVGAVLAVPAAIWARRRRAALSARRSPAPVP